MWRSRAPPCYSVAVTTTVDEPRIIGRYALYDEVAAGGMATVHLGRLMGPVGFSRTVAIKRLHPHYAKDAEFVAMFLDEARLAARIHHPNVVQTLDVVAVSGELFLVMDYVSGEPLSRLRKLSNEKGLQIRPRIVTSVLCGALHGLHAAHEATSDRGESLGIVHRDISPQNILVGVDGIARVLDFGVAKALGRVHTTRDGRLKGKLAYMAPEQLQGKATRRTDLFAASVVLWEALTGERLFTGDDEQEVVGQILSRAISPPSMFLHGEASTGITTEQLRLLDDVTLRGLARAPGERFETAREMALALEQCFGIASQAEVGGWVQSTAGRTLDDRAQRVAEIESHSSIAGRSPSTPVPMEAAPVGASEGARGSEDTLASTPVSSASRRRGAAVGIGLAGIILVVGGIGLTLRKSPEPQPSGLQSGQSADPSSRPLASPASTEGTAPLGAPQPTDSTAGSPPIEPGESSPPRPRASHPARPWPRNAAALSATQGKGASCDPSFTLDDQGRKHFKPECYLKKAP